MKLVKPLKKEKDEREETDPYWAMLKEDKVITSRFQDEFDMEKDDAHAYMDKVEQNIARYPVGFRHYENFDNYRTVYPDATIQDYFEVMNKQVEFDEYKEIMKAAFLEECKNPYFNWKNNYPDWEYVDQNEILTPDNFVASEFYDMEMRKEYAKTVKTYLLNKEWYSLVECLEDVCNFWSYGRNFATMPTYNTFMPTKTHLMDKPDMFDAENDDLGYRFNAQRLSSSGYLSTLKGFKMLPKALKKPIVDMNKPKFNKYRRLSNSKMNAFSTTVNQQSAAFTPKTQPPTTFLSSIFSSAGPFGTEKQNGWLFYRK